ncbi:DUF2927 domain-containing protein [uncultured Microscilla sp.]|uniref:DUF2927 domain-containing protein n=1 Tax=uncultured Microscilla sp. TaxID=432653 RepID=UPI0026157C8B|nr:DUF2927 domain-containing protein [uncultured Microscilla sp.]
MNNFLNTLYSYKLVIGLCSLIALVTSSTTFAQSYSSAVKKYFKEIAVGSEFGKGRKIVKWTKDIKIFVMGEKIPALETELNKIMGELNQLIRPVRMQRVFSKTQANFFIFFGSSNDYINKVEPNARRYANRNLALFYVYFTPKNSVDKGSMYVNTSMMKAPDTRKHLLREELTQALGLMNDSHKYAESIFYQKFSRATQYASIDKQLIQLLYSNKIRPGMSKTQVEQVLATL